VRRSIAAHRYRTVIETLSKGELRFFYENPKKVTERAKRRNPDTICLLLDRNRHPWRGLPTGICPHEGKRSFF
jgi:hypothetical protein